MTYADETRHSELSQGTAYPPVDLLATGSTVTAAAEAVGVTRQIASEWLNQNFEFQAALNRRQLELWNELSDRLRGLIPKGARLRRIIP